MRKKHWKSEAEAVFNAAGRDLLLGEPAAVLHALYCGECQLRGNAVLALALVGWTPDEYVSALADIEEGKLCDER